MKMKKNSTKILVTLALLVSVGMLLSYVEHLLPPLGAVPGVKIGLANIASVFALYVLGARCAVVVSSLRVLLSALLFGNVLGLLYSASGAACALIGMCLVKRLRLFSAVGVSVVGGVLHNAAQIVAASLVMRTHSLVLFYLPPLLISGTLAGVLIGLASGFLVERLRGKIK